jgi:hypothetical protein
MALASRLSILHETGPETILHSPALAARTLRPGSGLARRPLRALASSSLACFLSLLLSVNVPSSRCSESHEISVQHHESQTRDENARACTKFAFAFRRFRICSITDVCNFLCAHAFRCVISRCVLRTVSAFAKTYPDTYNPPSGIDLDSKDIS